MAAALPRLDKFFRRQLLAGTAACGVIVAASVGTADAASSLPQGGQVIGGSASISYASPTQLNITSTSNNSAIAWQSFDIAQGSKVTVNQPSATSTQLEQVTGTSASQIFGTLSSNGRIVVANPNGIWFGPSAQVDVAGLVATTAHAGAADVATFAAGGSLNLSQAGNAQASVVNQGTITISQAGLAAFVAPGVSNQGVIQAKLGKVQLASGTTATVDFYGDGLINLAVTGQTTAQALGPDGKPLSAAVSNSGTLNADGGTVLMTANVAAGVVDQVINTTGIVQARAVAQQGGQIILDGGDNGAVMVAGALDASGRGAGQSGGTVNVLGNNVQLASNAVVDVSGDAGGGTALIGGNFHGSGTQRKAATTTIAKGAKILADAISSGKGGQVAIWSEQSTNFDGTVSAKGGAQGGDGGQVETSGAQLLVSADASVDASAANGAAGDWLLDPSGNLYGNSAGSLPAGAPAGSSAFSTTSVQTTLNGGTNVTETANQDLIVTSPIAWNSGASLNLNAGHSILIEAPITHTFTTNGATLNLNYGTATGVLSAGNLTGGSLAIFGSHVAANLNGSVTLDATHDTLNINSTNYTLITSLSQVSVSGTTIAGNYALDADLSNISTNFAGDMLTGNFEGLGHTITNLTVASSLTGSGNTTLAPGIGLFGQVDGRVNDVGLVTPTISASAQTAVNLGALAGTNTGTISNSWVSGGSVTGPTSQPSNNGGEEGQGGLVGTNAGLIATSFTDGVTVSGSGKGSNNGTFFYALGGFVGSNSGTILGSFASNATVTSTNSSGEGVFAGGFIGDNSTTTAKGVFTNGTVLADIYFGQTPTASGNNATLGNFAANGPCSGAVPLSCSANPLTFSLTPDAKVYDGTTAVVADGNPNDGTVQAVGTVGGDLFLDLQEAFSSKNVGNSVPMTLLSSSLVISYGGGVGTNYFYTFNPNTSVNPANGVITPASVTVSGARIYDALTDASFSILTLNGVFGGDTVTLSGSGTLASKNVGNEALTSVGTLTLGGADAGNYQIVTAGSSVNITKANLTVSGTRIYDALTDANAAILTPAGVLGTDIVTVASGSGTLTGKDVGVQGFASLGNLALGGVDGGNYQIVSAGSSVTITKATLTVTADAQAKTYGQNDPVLTFQTVGLQGTDTIPGVLSGSLTRDLLGTLAGEQVGTYNITQGTLASNGNYSLVYVGNTLKINPLLGALSVTVNAGQGKVYGNNDPALGFTVAGLVNAVVDGVVINDTAAGLFAGSLARSGSGTFAGEQVGNYAITQGSLALVAGANYGGAFTFTGGNFAITPRPLTITANNQQKSPNTSLTFKGSEFTVSGLVDGSVDGVPIFDGVSSVTLASAGAPLAAPIGIYPISISNPIGTGLSNYSISLNPGTLTVGVPCSPAICGAPNVVQPPPNLSSVLNIDFINPTAGVACSQPPLDPNQRPDDANQVLNDLNRNPCLKENLIAVLPEANGHVGAVVVHTADGRTFLLNKAFAAVGSAAGSTDMRPVGFDRSDVSSDFTFAIQALPRIFTVYFGNGSAVMLPRSQLDFTRALGDIKQRGAKEVVITGHTDAVGTEAYNDALSVRRAETIERMLVKGGISPAGLKIVGDGTHHPAVPTSGNEPEGLNRRVVIDAH